MTVREILKVLRKDGWYTTNQEGSHIRNCRKITTQTSKPFMMYDHP